MTFLTVLTFYLFLFCTKACIAQQNNSVSKSLQSEGDSFLHVGVGCKSLVSQVLLNGSKDIKITRCEIGTVGSRVVHNLPAVAP